MSGFYQMLLDAARGTLTSLPTLHTMARLSRHEAADFCQIPWATYRRYLSDRKPPRHVLQLLRLRAGWIPLPSWDGFYFCAHDGRLYHHQLRDGFAPGDLLALHWLRQENSVLKAQERRPRGSTGPTPWPSGPVAPVDYGDGEYTPRSTTNRSPAVENEQFEVQATLDGCWMVHLIWPNNRHTIRAETEEEALNIGNDWLKSVARMKEHEASPEFKAWQRRTAMLLKHRATPKTHPPAGSPMVPAPTGTHADSGHPVPVDQGTPLEAAETLENGKSFVTYSVIRQAQGGAAARRPLVPCSSTGLITARNDPDIHYAQSDVAPEPREP